jgi:hypothetical protein
MKHAEKVKSNAAYTHDRRQPSSKVDKKSDATISVDRYATAYIDSCKEVLMYSALFFARSIVIDDAELVKKYLDIIKVINR